jgi:hypothetical protein
MLLSAEGLDELDACGEAQADDTLLLLLNAFHAPVAFRLPTTTAAGGWQVLLDSEPAATDTQRKEARHIDADESIELCGHSLLLLRAVA